MRDIHQYLDHGVRCGDRYVEGSQAYADYWQQLLPWQECLSRVPAYCHALRLPLTAADFVTHLRARLRDVTQRVDAAYPHNPSLTIDATGTPPQTPQGATNP
jgi:hypothetical protein